MLRTKHWDLVHAFGTSMEGWFVLILRRHALSFDELSVDEASSFGLLLRRVSGAMRDVLGCERTYVALFAEDPVHGHVHVHVVPRFANQPEDLRGPRAFSALGRPDAESVTAERMDELAIALRGRLLEGS